VSTWPIPAHSARLSTLNQEDIPIHFMLVSGNVHSSVSSSGPGQKISLVVMTRCGALVCRRNNIRHPDKVPNRLHGP